MTREQFEAFMRKGGSIEKCPPFTTTITNWRDLLAAKEMQQCDSSVAA